MPAPAKPSAVKDMAGNRGRRKNQNEPRPPETMPQPPGHLKGYGLEEWNRKVRDLHDCGILTVVDDAVFAAYCQSFGQWRAATEGLELFAATPEGKEGLGMFQKTKNGVLVHHPLLAVANSARKEMLRFAAQLGLTPSSRTGIHVPPKSPTSKAAKYGL